MTAGLLRHQEVASHPIVHVAGAVHPRFMNVWVMTIPMCTDEPIVRSCVPQTDGLWKKSWINVYQGSKFARHGSKVHPHEYVHSHWSVVVRLMIAVSMMIQ